jgi:DHA1 family multidrug/chloramphenicol efflux transport protein-like MFS transporter
MVKDKKIYLFVLALVIYEATTYAANDMIMPAMLSVIKEFSAKEVEIGFSLTLYILGDVLLILLLGPLADYYGKRKVIIGGNIYFIVCTILLAISGNMKLFLFGRLLQGAGLAFIAMGYALIHENFNDKAAVKLTSLMANITIMAPIFGPIIGGMIAHYSNWRMVFVVSIITASISLYGLINFAPKSLIDTRADNKMFDFKQLILDYIDILKIKKFQVGVIAITFLSMQSLCWIAFAPYIVMHNLGLSINKYFIYQAVALCGFLISTILNQLIAGRVSMVKLITFGSYTYVIGMIIALIFHSNIDLVAISISICCLGLGLQNGTMFRIVGKLKVKSQNLLFSLITFVNAIGLTVLLELANRFLNIFHYQLAMFVWVVSFFGILALFFVYKFVGLNKERNWQ